MAPPEAAADRCDVVIHRGHTGTTQTFPLSSGGVLRIGRGMANDVVLDFNGVSVYHCELYLRPSADPSQAGKQLLCIRDSSKNGTGVRPGPHSSAAEAAGPSPNWEPLKRDVLRVMEHGWQLMVPLRSRKDSLQLPEAWRTITVFVGNKPAGLAGSEEIDGEAWEPGTLSKVVAPAFGLPPPPPPDLGGGAFEQAPPPPAAAAAAVEEASDDEAEKDKAEKKRAKKEKKATKKREEAESDSDDEGQKVKKKKKDKKAKKQPAEEDSDEGEEPDRKDKKNKKDKKAKRRGDDDDEDAGPVDRKKREEREERERLERELEDELAEELNRKARGGAQKAGDDEDDGMSIHTGFTSVAPPARNPKATRSRGGDTSDVDEEDEVTSAWSRALDSPSAVAKAAAAGTVASGAASDHVSTAAVAGAAAAPAAPALPAVLEVLASEKAAGIFLRCGMHCGQPMYQRLKDDAAPIYAYYWDGAGDESCAGWYVATDPAGKKGHDDYLDFWKAEASLPATGAGECGGRMEIRSQLDGPALAALSQLPEAKRKAVRAAFTAAGAGAKGILEEESAEAVGDASSEPGAGGGADSSPMPSESSLPPWKRRRGLRSSMGIGKDSDAGSESGAAAAAAAAPDSAAAAAAAAGQADASKPAAEAGAEGAETGTEAGASGAEEPAKATGVEVAKADKADEADEAEAATASEAEKPAAEAVEAAAPKESEAAVDVSAPAEPAVPDESVAATDGTIVELTKAGEPTEGEATEPAGPDAAAAEEATPAEAGKADKADNASETSRVSFTATEPQKTVPGDRAESMAPTIPPADQLRGDSEAPGGAEGAKSKLKGRGAGLTTEALAAHTAALARAQAEAYAATFASARSHYSKSAAGRSVAGRTIGGMSIAGRSIAGKSIAGRSIAGKSIAASGIAPTERTFRTHMTTRELLVGGSEMRELMRSVSPISEPGVNVKVKKVGGKRGRKSPTREQTPAVSTTRVSPSPSIKKKLKGKKVKKDKKDKKVKKKDKSGKKVRPGTSPSHFQADASATPGAGASVAPSHWKDPSETPEPSKAVRAGRPKRAALRPPRPGGEPNSPISEDGVKRKKGKKRTSLLTREEVAEGGDTKRRRQK